MHAALSKIGGGSHALWMKPITGAVEAVPRHTEIKNKNKHESSLAIFKGVLNGVYKRV
jgi:hypothetical protein